MSAPIPLSAEDRAILELEGPTVAGHTCKVVRVSGEPLVVDQLRAHLESRIPRGSLPRRKLGDTEGAPAWVPDPDFDIANHVIDADRGPLRADELETWVADVFAERLDRSRPLWRMDRAALASGGSVIVWRLHHALADGTTAMRFAREHLWDEPGGPAPIPSQASLRHRTSDHERRRAHLAAFIKREWAESIHPSPFDGEVGARRSVGFASVPFAPLHDAAKSLAHGTVNDAVLSIVSGGLRRWLADHGEALHRIRIKVPVSLHEEGDDAGNRDSFFTVPVALAEEDPRARLDAIHKAAAARKRGHDAEEWESVASSLHRAPGWLGELADRLQHSPRTFAVCVSNVPGPRDRLRVLGREVRSVHSLAEIGRRHALRVAVISAHGNLNVGLTADPAIVPDLGAMARGIEAEATELLETVGFNR